MAYLKTCYHIKKPGFYTQHRPQTYIHTFISLTPLAITSVVSFFLNLHYQIVLYHLLFAFFLFFCFFSFPFFFAFFFRFFFVSFSHSFTRMRVLFFFFAGQIFILSSRKKKKKERIISSYNLTRNPHPDITNTLSTYCI